MLTRTRTEIASSYRDRLTPQMQEYRQFDDRSFTRHLPYLMYFHRADYRSDTINTDSAGFRYSVGPSGDQVTALNIHHDRPVNLLAGSSTALGMGASSDRATLPSRLWADVTPDVPWLNFAGRCYNSTQELMLLMLYRHLLGDIENIVVFSGLNNLTLARLPEWQQGDHGAFWFCGEYFAKMEELRREQAGRLHRIRRRWRGQPPLRAPQSGREWQDRRPLSAVVESSAELTLRHLAGWRRLAGENTRIVFALQPLALWVRRETASEEQLLFDEIDRISNVGTWAALYGDISTPEIAGQFAEIVRAGCARQGIEFIDLCAVLAEDERKDEWLYVDRAHFTDRGHAVVSDLLGSTLQLK